MDLQTALQSHLAEALPVRTTAARDTEDSPVLAAASARDVVESAIESSIVLVNDVLRRIQLPSRKEVEDFAGQMFDKYIAPRLPQRPIMLKLARAGFVSLVLEAYDAAAKLA